MPPFYPPILRRTNDFVIYRSGKQLRLCATSQKQKVMPKSRRIRERDLAYLMDLNDFDFNSSAVMDFGVGVFKKENRDALHSEMV